MTAFNAVLVSQFEFVLNKCDCYVFYCLIIIYVMNAMREIKYNLLTYLIFVSRNDIFDDYST